jgi:hypothetical protein
LNATGLGKLKYGFGSKAASAQGSIWLATCLIYQSSWQPIASTQENYHLLHMTTSRQWRHFIIVRLPFSGALLSYPTLAPGCRARQQAG